MGGVIDVASEQNRGSTFWFEIRMEPVAAAAVLAVPAARAAAERLPAAAALPARVEQSAAPSVGPLILVVEDNAVNREVAAGMLENLAYRSESAINGMLALEAVAESAYAAVLMDCQMPVMDGLTATHEIRRREAGSGGRVPIIALTANAMEANRERCLAAGMDDFLPKPFTQLQLKAVLGRWAPVAQAPQSDQALLAAGDIAQPAGAAATVAAATVAAAPAAAVIDKKVLRNIACLGRPALLGSLIDLYFEHSLPLIETIEAASQGQEPEGLAEALHTLKSSSANLGGARLTELLKECEALAHERGAAAVPELGTVPAAYHEFCEALIRERSALAA
jgi:CheY-like chemotaxis protein/HPt (histidine-containing phosphotransfer) domain-containing protein